MEATCLRIDLRALRVVFRDLTEIPMRRSVNRRLIARLPPVTGAGVGVAGVACSVDTVGEVTGVIDAVGASVIGGIIGVVGAVWGDVCSITAGAVS